MELLNDNASEEYNTLKRLEYVLNNKSETFPNKVESLIKVWAQVSHCRLTEHHQYVVHLMDWLKLHTLNIVLTGDWKKYKDIYEEKLLGVVKHCEMLLLHSNNIFSLRCRKLAEVIKDPWGNPILNRLLNDPNVVVGSQEIEFFSMETGYLISTRLRKLCESHCEDLALNLVGSFMSCQQLAEAQHINLNATEDQKRFILDVYIALLYKYRKTELIITTLKSLSLLEGLELLKRFAHKRVNISKIWRHSNRIAHLAAQVYITAAVVKPPEESVTILEALLDTWFSLNDSTESLESLMSAIRRIIQPADSAVHLYIFCEAVRKKFGVTMKTFTIELYIRALTTGMNDLERQKNEDDTAKVSEITEQLAQGFLRLADVLEENVKVSRECVLTSFSLQPTQETLDRIIKLAERSGYEVLDTGQSWKCNLHPPINSSDELCWKCDLCGEFMSKPQFETILNTNTALSEALSAEQLGLSSQLCDDLVVVLSSPRYQLFNWLMRWQDLHRLCVLYLNDPQGTKNLVTELKFLDIDYSIFIGMKREPEDEEITGIERGYERYLFEEELYTQERSSPTSEDSRPYSSGSDGMGEHLNILLPPPAKSDPKVLKSLRLFRPTLKRAKSTHLEGELPSKIFVSSESVTPLPIPSSYSSSDRTQMNEIVNKYLNTQSQELPLNLVPRMLANSSNLGYPYVPIPYANEVFKLGSLIASFKNHANLSTASNTEKVSDNADSCFLTTPVRSANKTFNPFGISPLSLMCSNSIGPYTSTPNIQQGAFLKMAEENFLGSNSGLQQNTADFYKNEIKSRWKQVKANLKYLVDRNAAILKYNSKYFEDLNSMKNNMDSASEPQNLTLKEQEGTEAIEQKQPCDSNYLQPNILNLSRYNHFNAKQSLSSQQENNISAHKEIESGSKTNSCSTKPTTCHRSKFPQDIFTKNSVKALARRGSIEISILDNSNNAQCCKISKESTITSSTSTTSSNFKINLNNIPKCTGINSETSGSTVNFNNLEEGTVIDLSPASNKTALEKGSSNKDIIKKSGLSIATVTSDSSIAKIHNTDTSTPSNYSKCTKITQPENSAQKTVEVKVQSNNTEHSTSDRKLVSNTISTAKCSTDEVISSSSKEEIVCVTNKSDDKTSINEENRLHKELTTTNTNNANVSTSVSAVSQGEKNNSLVKTIEKNNDKEKLCDTSPSKRQLFPSSNVDAKSTTSRNSGKSFHYLDPTENQVSSTDKQLSKNLRESEELSNFPHKDSSNENCSKCCGTSNNICSCSTTEKRRNVCVQTTSNSTGNNSHRSWPIPYVDMSKNVITFASNGTTKFEINYCLHKTKSIHLETSSESCLIPVVKNVPTNSTGPHSKNGNSLKQRYTDQELLKKYNIKEARVFLHRINLSKCLNKRYIKLASKFYRSTIPTRRQTKRELKKDMEISENKAKYRHQKNSGIYDKRNNGLKSCPLKDINPKVQHKDGKANVFKAYKCKNELKTDSKLMNACVILKRLDLEKDKRHNTSSLLANIPGLNDLQMIRPSSVDRIVQVVQVPGTPRSTTIVSAQSTQTSTQVTPHIQRIGQPRTEKPEPSIVDSVSICATTTTTTTTVASTNTTSVSGVAAAVAASITTAATTTNTTSTATSTTTTTTTTAAATTVISSSSTMSESPTLINILSQQVIRPNSQNNCVTTRPRTSPIVNILSQQIIKPAAAQSSTKTSGNTDVQVNSIPRVISGGDQILNQLVNPVRASTPTLKTLVSAPASDQNRIVQFICKSSDGKLIPVTSFTSSKVVKVSMTQTVSSSVASSTTINENYTKSVQNVPKIKETTEISEALPKFQQAFGKSAYQNSIDSTECVTTNSDSNAVNTDVDKSTTIKNSPKNLNTSLNVQPVQGGVIYTRQMPVGQTINLIPPGRGQVFRIATSNTEQLSLVKDTVIHGRMSALLAAALQGKQRTGENEAEVNSEELPQTRVALTTRPALVQNARIVKPVLQIPSNVIRSTPQSNLSSTTLEQLREFDMVYKQVKERSSTSAPTESSPQSDSNEPPQQISVTYLNQGQKINCTPVVVVSSYCSVQPAASPSLSVTSQGSPSPCVTPAPTLTLSKAVTKNAKAKSIKNTTTHTTKASPIPKPQQKPQEDEHTTQRIFDILAEYAEQLRNSPDLNNKPAPRRRSNPPTNPSQNAKRKKSSSSKKTGHCSNSLASDGDIEDTHTVGSEDSSCGVVQISVQEEEQPLAVVNTSEPNDAAVSPKQLILTDSTPNQSRSLIIADSNVGEALKMSNTAVLVPGNYIMPVSMVKGGQQIAVVSGGSKILATVPARSGPNMLLFQSFLNQSRKQNVPTVKYSAVQPVSGITRNISGSTTQTPVTSPATSQNLTAVNLGQTVALQKVNHLECTDVNTFDTELLLTIAHTPDNRNNIPEQTHIESQGASSSNENVQSIRVSENILSTETTIEKTFTYEEKPLVTASVATSVIAQSISIKEKVSEEHSTTSAQTIMALNLNSSENDKDTTIKVEGRVQSVLVATGTSNGPMLSHSPPVYNKQTDSTNSISDSNKDEYLRNKGKTNNNEKLYVYEKKKKAGASKQDKELQQLSLQQRKQAALERELRLQKSLSEECEDLGVDEPSTSDLFPEADLLFDSNQSPFDQPDLRRSNVQESKEEVKAIGLFCDDEPMRTDFLFEPIEFPSTAVDLDYNRSRDMTNGQGNTSNESGFSCEDNTLLQTCTSMSDVTIPSPISPDLYTDNSSQQINKCKYKYSNRKKNEKSKHIENWPMELSSSEDTTGSTELTKICGPSPEIYSGRYNRSLSCCDDDGDLLSFAIVERLPLKEGEECEGVHCQEAIDCPSGRGARRSVKKLCSCCNGSVKVARKRPASRPPTPFTKKTVIAKKR